MRKLIWCNVAWNTIFVLMGLSEMVGATAVHPALPGWAKWIWLCALAGGNLVIHALQLARVK